MPANVKNIGLRGEKMDNYDSWRLSSPEDEMINPYLGYNDDEDQNED